MNSIELSPHRDYVGRALRDQHNLISIGGCGLLALAFWSPLPLVIGGVWEVLWLLFAPRLDSFRSYADGYDTHADKLGRERAMAAEVSRLSAPLGERFSVLGLSLQAGESSLRERGVVGSGELGAVSRAFDRMRLAFLDAALAEQRVSALLGDIPEGPLEEEAERLRGAASAEKNLELRMELRKALGETERRLGQHERLSAAARSMQQRLTALEQGAEELRQHAASTATLAEIDAELSVLLGSAGNTQYWNAMIKDALSSTGPIPGLMSFAPPNLR